MEDVRLVSNVVPGTIHANFDEFFANVTKQVEPYKGLVFTDDQIGDAKKLVAKLNKDRKEVEDRRKDVKRSWLEPYDAFEKKVKDALKIIDEAINPLKDQINEAERKRIEDRKEKVQNILSTVIDNRPSADFINSCEWLYDPRWENASVTLKNVMKQVEERVEALEADLNVIMTMEFSKELLAEYRKSGNLAQTLIVRDRLVQEKKEIDDYAERMANQKPYPEATDDPIEDAVISEDPVEEDKYGQAPPELMTITFSATGTREQLEGLKTFCVTNGIVIQRA